MYIYIYIYIYTCIIYIYVYIYILHIYKYIFVCIYVNTSKKSHSEEGLVVVEKSAYIWIYAYTTIQTLYMYQKSSMKTSRVFTLNQKGPAVKKKSSI